MGPLFAAAVTPSRVAVQRVLYRADQLLVGELHRAFSVNDSDSFADKVLWRSNDGGLLDLLLADACSVCVLAIASRSWR